ncbi:YbgA family protein [Natranaerobius trueperi]|uniref:Cytoplasmic protein n=1 Tax=Natranaerobius trueperi TaxID=759412 RepID=A0A226C096_9FIRM|nr:DUF523 and DUF1722 domain-containing protein [Natranaerobius trueperi]OWZ84673.1 cytoplasmic protein [Natranaerobius trueperi]
MSEDIPKVLISSCLGFSACRYDGSIIREDFIEELKNFVKFIPVCPEVGIGLDTPRDVLRLYRDNDSVRLYQKDTDTDLTEGLREFSSEFFSELGNIEGAILKNRSPSCAVKDAKIYTEKESNITETRESGLFTKELLQEYPKLTVEDEGRLTNLKIRENFLTSIFTLNRFNKIYENGTANELIEFHKNHKFLIMSYNEEKMRKLGKLVASQDKFSREELFNLYHKNLVDALHSDDTLNKKINVLMHIMGFFKDKANSDEKAFLLDTLEKYRNNQLPPSVPINILKSWAVKYEEDYLLSQYFFSPFPEELLSLDDSGKTR